MAFIAFNISSIVFLISEIVDTDRVLNQDFNQLVLDYVGEYSPLKRKIKI